MGEEQLLDINLAVHDHCALCTHIFRREIFLAYLLSSPPTTIRFISEMLTQLAVKELVNVLGENSDVFSSSFALTFLRHCLWLFPFYLSYSSFSSQIQKTWSRHSFTELIIVMKILSWQHLHFVQDKKKKKMWVNTQEALEIWFNSQIWTWPWKKINPAPLSLMKWRNVTSWCLFTLIFSSITELAGNGSELHLHDSN